MPRPVSFDRTAARGLGPDQLRRVCDPAALGFRTTEDLPPPEEPVGQQRAMDAVRLATAMRRSGFNLFVLGPPGTGRHRAVDRLLGSAAARRPVPDDWAYVHNFEAPDRPQALRLPPGRAADLGAAMRALVDDLAIDIPAMFDSEEYQAEKRSIEQAFAQGNEEAFAEFVDRARKDGVEVFRTPTGFTLAAVVDGEVLKPDTYERLDAEQRAAVDARVEAMQQELAQVLKAVPGREREHRKRPERLHAMMAQSAVADRIAEVTRAFADQPDVSAYLEQVHADMVASAELFLKARAGEGAGPFPEAVRKFHHLPMFRRYAVNVIVSRGGGGGAPVVTEDLPTLANLTGRIDHASHMGALVTDFTLIKPGALHRANGGFLVLEARRLLGEPYAWDALKRSLDAGRVQITTLAERMSLFTTTSLEPDPIPLDLRVVLIADRQLYRLLVYMDPDVTRLFKLQADFEETAPRTAATVALFARQLAEAARRDGLMPLTAAAVAGLVDHASRLASDTERMSLQVGRLSDVMREADHLAATDGHAATDSADVAHALEQAEHRAARVRDLSQQMIARRTVLIDTAGGTVGQINGLSVVDTGTHRFGRPSRITARVRQGSGRVVDIEREVELGGPLHSKGVLVLSGYLTAHYALDVPMSLQASLVFEQSYGGVDGDSASTAELCALLSALSDLPIRQGLAVTGSVNQLGEVQAIGGVTEKIEGFFRVCKARRLTGQQGVLIPQANVKHLMLRDEVVEAVRRGAFHVFPVATIDAAIELLTGHPAGRRQRGGGFPGGSVNARVEARLRRFAELRRGFAPAVRTER
ncbi:Lon protease family protein [Halovulum marinum]|nr:ATP-binding protein [Halovulum marinum]